MFNEGSKSRLHILNEIGVGLGHHAHDYARKEDAMRIHVAQKRAMEESQEQRIIRRQRQIEVLESAEQLVDLFYETQIGDDL